jgi:hypothetical protein
LGRGAGFSILNISSPAFPIASTDVIPRSEAKGSDEEPACP